MNIIDDLKNMGIALNTQQTDAVLDQSRYLLLLAVPGSGKTTVMVCRIAHLISYENVSPRNMLTLTFSREAAGDMTRRFSALFPALVKPKFSTIHSFCYSVLHHYARLNRRQLPQNIETESGPISKAALLRQIYNSMNQDFIGDDALDMLSAEIAYIKNMMLSKSEIKKHTFETAHIDSIFEQYEKFKKERNWMDFDDMLSLCLDIFKKYPDILEQYRRKYRYIQVDEAQDTSLLQHKIIEMLAINNTSLFMVGDEDQSIYSFRGAYPEALIRFSETYPGAKILKMEENFRSEWEIVDKANHFIKQNKDRYEKNMFCANRTTDCIYDMELPDYSYQYTEILKMTQKLKANETMAVLYRNNESSLPLIDLFDKKGIPFYIKEHRASFFNHFIVRDILSFFRLSKNPNDLDAFKNIYYKLYLSKKIYQYVVLHCTEYDNIFDVVLSLKILKDSTAYKIREMRDKLPSVWKMPPLRAIQYIEDRLGYSEYINSRAANGYIPENLHQKLNILKAVAAGFQNIEDFITRLQELEQMILNSDRKTACVTLSTMHSSKGLEFDHVVILDLIEGLFPSSAAIEEKLNDNRELYEEEVRLFYVAATRAKKRLYLFESHKINGCKAYPSRFLYHLLGEEMNPQAEICGKKVYHNVYKNGTVIESQDEDNITVEFEWFGTKTISLSYCLEQGIIKFI